MQIPAEDVLIIGQPVIAAEPHVVAEEGEPQRIGHRLRDDRQINAGDARAKGEPTEHEGEQARHQHHHRHGPGEMVEPPPEPGQFLVLQEHHEVRQQQIAVYAAGADLPHQIHAHAIAAEREERTVAKAQYAGIAPDQIEAQRQDRVAQIFAEQWHEVVRHGERRIRRDPAVQQRDQQAEHQPAQHKAGPEPGIPRASLAGVEACRHHSRLRVGGAALQREQAARPPLDEQDDRHQHGDLAEDRAGIGFEQLVDPIKLPTPPNTTTIKLSTM